MSVDEAVEAVARIGEMLESEEIESVWHKAPHFFESVQEQVSEVEETILEKDRVTEAQARALTNWEAGLMKWHDKA